MKLQTLELFLKQYLRLFDKGPINFYWHGGEPLLAGIDFFKKIIFWQKQYSNTNHKIKNHIETNATLINPKWAKFFYKHNFCLGVSIDGSRAVHDKFRVDIDNKGTYQRVTKAIKILQQNKVNVKGLVTLKHDSLSDLSKSFKVFTKLKLKAWVYNIFFEPNHKTKLGQQSIREDEYTNLLKKCIKLWLEHDNNISIREIDEYLALSLDMEPRYCFFQGTCANHFGLDYNGDVYPCTRLTWNKKVYFGNIHKDSLKNILYKSPNRKKFIKKINILPKKCQRCNIKKLCNNGCTQKRINGQYYYCSTRKDIYNYLKKIILKYNFYG